MSTPAVTRAAARMLLVDQDTKLLLFRGVDRRHGDVASWFTSGVESGEDLAATGEALYPPALADLLALGVGRGLAIAEERPA